MNSQNSISNSVSETVSVSVEKKAKKPAPRAIEIIIEELKAATEVEKVMELSSELKRAKKISIRTVEKAKAKEEKSAKREKNSRTLKALKRIFDALTVGDVLTVTVTNETGEELFAHTATVPAKKVKPVDGEVKPENPPAAQ